MPKVLLSVPHHPQQDDGDCLAACAAMVLAWHGRDVRYDEIRAVLRIRPFGAPAANVRLLTAFGVRVVYSITSLAGLRQLLDDGQSS